MTGSIHHADNLYLILSEGRVTDFLLRDESILYIRQGKDYLYSQTLFSLRVPIPETEEWVLTNFDQIKTLSSLAIDSMVNLSPGWGEGRRFAWHLLGEKAVLAEGLAMHTREYALPGSYEGMSLYDRRAAHVACAYDMLFPLPYALYIKRKPSPLEFALALEREGCSRVKCVVVEPSRVQGILSRRLKKDDIITYPNGVGETWWGTYTHNELRYAVANGIRVLAIDWTMAGRHATRYLAPFCQFVVDKRNVSDAYGKTLAKLLGNRLFGRLGMLPGEGQHYKPQPGGALYFAQNHWAPKNVPQPKTNRLWGAMVFAEQRMAMHKVLEKSTMPVYAHTDSVICQEFHGGDIGSYIGSWEFQEKGFAVVGGLGQYAMKERKARRGLWLPDTERTKR